MLEEKEPQERAHRARHLVGSRGVGRRLEEAEREALLGHVSRRGSSGVPVALRQGEELRVVHPLGAVEEVHQQQVVVGGEAEEGLGSAAMGAFGASAREGPL
ncbi:MAG: hypothetical protein HZB55_06190 [Deltaproteobacteria bacterium]|nr:hypothetical protein [Deltaproteobacteria bacterium]